MDLMDASGKASVNAQKEGIELGGGDDGAEVVVVISGEEEEALKASRIAGSSFSLKGTLEMSALKEGLGSSTSGFSELDTPKSTVRPGLLVNLPSPETLKSSRINLGKPPKIPTGSVTRVVSLSKPKSRFAEPPISTVEQKSPVNQDRVDAIPSSPYRNSPLNGVVSASASPRENVKTAPVTPKTPLIESPEDDDDDEEIYKSENVPTETESSRKKIKLLITIEWIAFICTMGCLLASLTIPKLKKKSKIWGLELWKWSVLVMVILCGRLFAEWFINVIVILVEKNFLLRKKVLYFVYGLKKSVQVFLWLGLVLLAWVLLFNHGVDRSKEATKVLNYVSRALIGFLVGAAIWLVKTLLLKLLASSFHVSTFFDRIEESIFHQYILKVLSGPPVMELAESIRGSRSSGHLSFQSMRKDKGKVEQEVIDVSKLRKMGQKKVSAWTMKGLMGVITSSGLSTISHSIEEMDEEEHEQKEKEITCEWEAKAAAYQIFKNVARPGHKYIDREDLQRFLSKEEVDSVLPLFEGGVETGKIKKATLRNWVVNVYLERKSLAYSLNDTKTAVKQLNKLTSVVVLLVIIIVWLVIMGFATTEVLVFISSQILLVVFMFGNTAKVIFEAIIFVFVMHPFDVGDRCVIDGVQMVVEEMNILTTVFLRYDNEKIYVPNAVLATKFISNYYKSPSMSDSIEFSIDVSTIVETDHWSSKS